MAKQRKLYTPSEVQKLKLVFDFEVGDPVYAMQFDKKGEVIDVLENSFLVKLDGRFYPIPFVRNSEKNFFTSALRPIEYSNS